jgi:hypothetical protein
VEALGDGAGRQFQDARLEVGGEAGVQGQHQFLVAAEEDPGALEGRAGGRGSLAEEVGDESLAGEQGGGRFEQALARAAAGAVGRGRGSDIVGTSPGDGAAGSRLAVQFIADRPRRLDCPTPPGATTRSSACQCRASGVQRIASSRTQHASGLRQWIVLPTWLRSPAVVRRLGFGHPLARPVSTDYPETG